MPDIGAAACRLRVFPPIEDCRDTDIRDRRESRAQGQFLRKPLVSVAAGQVVSWNSRSVRQGGSTQIYVQICRCRPAQTDPAALAARILLRHFGLHGPAYGTDASFQ